MNGIAVFFVGMIVGASLGVMAMALVYIGRGDDDDDA